jgi:hypothetical protein
LDPSAGKATPPPEPIHIHSRRLRAKDRDAAAAQARLDAAVRDVRSRAAIDAHHDAVEPEHLPSIDSDLIPGLRASIERIRARLREQIRPDRPPPD